MCVCVCVLVGGWVCVSQMFPDASLVKASAPESRSAMQVAPLEISIAERSGHRHAAAASSKL